MVRYKPVDLHLSKLLPAKFSEQILPSTFEYALNWLVDHEIDLSVFDALYCNDESSTLALIQGGGRSTPWCASLLDGRQRTTIPDHLPFGGYRCTYFVNPSWFTTCRT